MCAAAVCAPSEGATSADFHRSAGFFTKSAYTWAPAVANSQIRQDSKGGETSVLISQATDNLYHVGRIVPVLGRADRSRRALVIVEYAAKTWTATNAPDEVRRRCARDQRVPNPLMIPLPVIVLDVLRDRPAQMTLPKRDHTVQALLFDRSHEPLRVGVGIRCLIRRLHHTDPGLAQSRPHRCAPFRVAITDQHVTVAEHMVAP